MAASYSLDPPRSVPSTFNAGLIFTAVGVLQRGVALVLLPVFLVHVSSADYGRLAIAWSVAGALAAVSAMGLEAAVFRGYFTVPQSERDAYIVSNSLFVAGTSALVAGVLILAAAGVGGLVETGVPLKYFSLSLAASALYVAATAVPLAVLRAERRLVSFVAVNLAFVGFYVGLMLFLVVLRDDGATGWLLAQLGASAAAALAAMATLWHRRSAPALSWVVAGLALGLPLVPHTLAHWGLSLSDRLILGIWVSASEVGVYNVAYQLAAGLGLVYVAVNHSVMAEYGRALRGELDLERLGRLVHKQTAFIFVTGIAAAIFGPVLVKAIMPAAYDGAGRLLPWLVVANVLFGLYLIPMNSITLLSGNTRRVWMATVVSAVVNVTLNFILIPTAGTSAAAATTVVSYGVLLVIVTLLPEARHSGSPTYPTLRVVASLAVTASLSALAGWLSPQSLASAVAAAAAWTLLGSLLVLALLRSPRPAASEAPDPIPSRA